VTAIYLIRHAHNPWMQRHRLAGWLPGIHLDEVGEQQAANLAQLLATQRLAAVYSSPLERAAETAAPLAAALGLEVVARPGLGEVRYGRWEGQSLKTLRRRKLWRLVQGRPSLARFPEGDSFTEAQARIVTELETLRARHRRSRHGFACVSHADPIKLALAHYLGLPLDLFQRLVIDPASISILLLDDFGARVARLNDTRAGEAKLAG
jgi:probable phosphoglycerate mutase